MHADPLKILLNEFQDPTLYHNLLFKFICRFFSTEEGRRDGNWIAERCRHSTGTRQASLRLTGRFSLLPLAAAPTRHILPPSVLRVTGFPSSLSLPHIFFETFVRHWSTFCALCCYKFIPLLGVLGRLNFIFEKSKRIEMEKKKKVSCHIPIGIP